jgi:hypothetical protein
VPSRNTALLRPESEKKSSELELATLLKEINRLEAIIESYQGILLKVKHKYL